METHGKPLALYVDRHSTFKINRQATVEEELRTTQAQSQYARVMDQLRIELIFTPTPQTKGRVERLFETLQDRLVKEMRLEGICGKDEGTRYFREIYIPKHNRKFAVPPQERANLHRSLVPHHDDLTRILSIQSQRVVSKDLLVQYKNTRYQMKPPKGYRYSMRSGKVAVVETEDGTISFLYKGISIPHTINLVTPVQRNTTQIVTAKSFTERRVHIPSPNHPWRQGLRSAQ